MTQSAKTTENPYKIYKNGVFFRSETGKGIQITGKGNLETIKSIEESLNIAFQTGFQEAAEHFLNKTL